VVIDQSVIYRLERGELDAYAARRSHVADYTFRMKRMLAAYFYAYVGANGKFGDGRKHAAHAQIPDATGDAVQAITIANCHGTILLGAVKLAL
jgi:hypothetical protein